MTTIDAHVGDAIFRLTARVHHAVNEATGWNPPELTAEQVWEPVGGRGVGCRRYQMRVRDKWVVFAPSGSHESYFSFYVSRSNAAGFRRGREFPNVDSHLVPTNSGPAGFDDLSA